MTKPARSGTGQEQAKQGKTREASIRYDLSQDGWDLARDQGNKHFAGQMRLHLGPSLDGLRSDETRELLVRRGIRFITFRCRTHGPKWPTLADQLVNTLAKTLADFAASEEAVGYGRPEPGDEVTVECVLSPDAAMEAELLGRTGAGLEAVERPSPAEKPEEPDEEIVAKPLEKIHNTIPIVDEPPSQGGPLPSPRSSEKLEEAQAALRRLVEEFASERERQAARLQPVLTAYMRSWEEQQEHATEEGKNRSPDEIAQAKKELAERVNEALERLNLSIYRHGQPCDLRVVVANNRRRGGFLLTAKGSGEHLTQKANLSDLFNFLHGEPQLRRDSQRREALSEWREQERARQAKRKSPPMK